MMGFRKNAGIAGTGDLLEGSRPLAALDRHGIRVVRATVTSIDPEARAADAAGERIEADALLVALGVEFHPEAVPGLAAHGINAYDAGQVPVAAAAVAARADGRAVIGIFGAPYRCPPAPYELALLLRDAHPDLDLAVFTPQPSGWKGGGWSSGAGTRSRSTSCWRSRPTGARRWPWTPAWPSGAAG